MKKGFTLAEVSMAKRTSGVENEVFDPSESKPKEPSNKNKKFAAFTLAEVLITLAIIGVVAALTIPTVVSKYQKHQYYTLFMKTYNTLSTVIQMAIAENGDMHTWGYYEHDNQQFTHSEVFKKYFYPYLKIDKVCSSADNGSSCQEDYNYMICGDMHNRIPSTFGLPPDSDMVFLQDGSLILELGYEYLEEENEPYRITILVDTNGLKKPNTVGRDIFDFELLYSKKLVQDFFPIIWQNRQILMACINLIH